MQLQQKLKGGLLNVLGTLCMCIDVFDADCRVRNDDDREVTSRWRQRLRHFHRHHHGHVQLLQPTFRPPDITGCAADRLRLIYAAVLIRRITCLARLSVSYGLLTWKWKNAENPKFV